MTILSQLDVFHTVDSPPGDSAEASVMEGSSYEYYDGPTESSVGHGGTTTDESASHREPEWVTFATPICIGVAILICFAKIMCRNCSSNRGNAREGRGDSLSSENSQQHWFQRSQQQFAANSGIPPMIDAFFPAPPKYEDVMRAKEEESLEGGVTPPRYSIQSSLASTVVSSSSDGSESPSEHDAPPDYSTMVRPATRTRRITVATASIDGPDEVVVVATSGRDNHGYAGDSDAPSTSSSSNSSRSPRSARSLAHSDRRESARNGESSRNGARPVALNVETLSEDAEWEVARC